MPVNTGQSRQKNNRSKTFPENFQLIKLILKLICLTTFRKSPTVIFPDISVHHLQMLHPGV